MTKENKVSHSFVNLKTIRKWMVGLWSSGKKECVFQTGIHPTIQDLVYTARKGNGSMKRTPCQTGLIMAVFKRRER